MEDLISKEELLEKLKEKLSSMRWLTRIYIGKTNDIERRGNEHQHNDNLEHTILLAIGEPKLIGEAEKYLVSYFKNDKRFYNNQNIGGGSPQSDKLYISFACDMTKVKSIDELDADDLNWPTNLKLK